MNIREVLDADTTAPNQRQQGGRTIAPNLRAEKNVINGQRSEMAKKALELY